MSIAQLPDTVWASNSSLIEHRSCPQKWYYARIRKLEKIDPDDPRVEKDMGSWWHALRAADAIERGRRHRSLQSTPETLTTVDYGPEMAAESVTVEEVFERAALWWRAQTDLVKETWEARIGEGLPERLRYVYDRWRDMWSAEIATERPLAVEMRWERELPVDDFLVVLVGYIDEIYRDTKRNIIVVRDDKISKTLDSMVTGDDMMDSQLQLYAWGASPIVSSWGVGKIQATAYDRSRMKKPTTPVVTQMGNLSKSVTDYDWYTYRTWTDSEPAYPGRTKDGSQAGIYELEPSVEERLLTPAAMTSWFQRTLTPLNPNLIRAHLRAAADSAIDMSRTRKRAISSGEAPRNLTSACRWCDFVKLCRAEMVGGPDSDFELEDFQLRKRPV